MNNILNEALEYAIEQGGSINEMANTLLEWLYENKDKYRVSVASILGHSDNTLRHLSEDEYEELLIEKSVELLTDELA